MDEEQENLKRPCGVDTGDKQCSWWVSGCISPTPTLSQKQECGRNYYGSRPLSEVGIEKKFLLDKVSIRSTASI